MTHIDDTLLSAYIDNELDADAAQTVSHAIENNADIRERYQKLKATNQAVKNVFAEVDALTERDDLAQLIQSADLSKAAESSKPENNVINLFDPSKQNKHTQGHQKMWAVAASVLLCTLLIYQLVPSQSGIPYQHLTEQLNTKLSGTIASYEAGRSELVQSWRNASGQVCRDIIWHAPEQSQPMTACLENGQWQWQSIQISQGYQTASDESAMQSALSKDEELLLLQSISP